MEGNCNRKEERVRKVQGVSSLRRPAKINVGDCFDQILIWLTRVRGLINQIILNKKINTRNDKEI